MNITLDTLDEMFWIQQEFVHIIVKCQIFIIHDILAILIWLDNLSNLKQEQILMNY